jgi:CheY-like chemotaxis protein
MKRTQVLVVEDEIITALDLQNDLEGAGFEVCSLASSGKQALEVAETEGPDVVLMDVRLRGEMDGVEAAAAIRARFGIPTIFMTGYSDEKTQERMQAVEPCRYLVKPVELGAVREAIDSVLGTGRIRSPVSRT